MKVSLSDLVDTPSLYRNKRVEISGYVVRNEYYGDKYVTWQLIMEENGKRIYCYEDGDNPDVITKCVNLAEEAKENNEKITVTGRLRQGGYRELIVGTILELETFEYKGYKIDTDFGEFGLWCNAHGTYDFCNY
jgi:uncharacterized membrane protein YcgQ (UPF0703/DUF1980 family)